MSAWIDIATLAHTKNLNGGLVARSASGLPFLMEEGMELALVPPVLDAPRNVTVGSVVMRGEDQAHVRFDEVSNAHVAEMLVGCRCLVLRDEVQELLDEWDDVPSWDGWSVRDERIGALGVVGRIEDRPVQPLLVVEREGGAELLVPLVDEFVIEVDEAARSITLSCPDGLFDL